MKFDNSFVKKLRNRDQTAFEELYSATKDRIYRFILFKVCGNREIAEDILSEVYCDAIRYSSSLTSAQNIPAWLYRIAKSKITDYFRKSAVRKKRLNLYTLPDSDFSAIHDSRQIPPDEKMVLNENRLFIAAVLSRLPEECQSILTGKYLDGLSVQEIAEKTGKSVKAAESMLFRSRKQFIKEIKRMERETRYEIPKGRSL